MNDGVFFAVSPLLWEPIPSFWLFFGVSFVVFSLFYGWQQYQIYSKKHISFEKPILSSLPSLEDENFEKKAFSFLKGFVAYTFAPKHSFSHSNADIIYYCDDLQLKEIWFQLENARYQSSRLSQKERQQIYSILRSYIS